MNFFTHEWMTGQLSDEEYEQIPYTYRRHLKSLRLPREIRRLAFAVNLHDGRVLKVRHDADLRVLEIRVRCGDLQRRYRDQFITYHEALISDESMRNLHDALAIPHDEMLYEEVDRVDEAYVHRVILQSFREIHVQFSAVDLRMQLVDRRDSP